MEPPRALQHARRYLGRAPWVRGRLETGLGRGGVYISRWGKEFLKVRYVGLPRL